MLQRGRRWLRAAWTQCPHALPTTTLGTSSFTQGLHSPLHALPWTIVPEGSQGGGLPAPHSQRTLPRPIPQTRAAETRALCSQLPSPAPENSVAANSRKLPCALRAGEPAPP